MTEVAIAALTPIVKSIMTGVGDQSFLISSLYYLLIKNINRQWILKKKRERP